MAKRVSEQIREVLEAYPGAVYKKVFEQRFARNGSKLLECEEYSEQRQVAEQSVLYNYQQRHKVKLPALLFGRL